MSPRLLLLPWAEQSNASARCRIFDLDRWMRSRGLDSVAAAPVGGKLGAALSRAGGGHILRRGIYVVLQLCMLPNRMRRAAAADLIILQREAFPFGPPLFERRILASGKPVIYDVDDALHIPPSHFRSIGHRIRRFDKAEMIARTARAVVVSSAELEAWARPIARHVVRIPTPVDTDRYRPLVGPPRNDPPIVGWTGTAGNLAHLESIRPALARLHRERSLRVVVIGERPPSTWAGLPVEFIPWSQEAEREWIPRFDAGLMPLIDSPYARAKAGYKALVYMACGVPAVVSPVGTNREILEHGTEGFFASTQEEWVTALDRLLADPFERAAMGARARERVVRERSIDALFPIWIDLIREIAG